MSEIIRIARCTLLLDDPIPRLGAMFKKMLKQGADSCKFHNFVLRGPGLLKSLMILFQDLVHCLREC